MTIRQAQTSDAKSIQSLLDQLGYPDFDLQEVIDKINLHEEPGYRILVASVDDQVVGFISLHWFDLMHWHGKLGRITSFCVDLKLRSQGIGHQLLGAGEKIFAEAGCLKFEVTSNLKRKRAHDFYLKEAYLEDSRRFVKNRDQP